jgi:chromosome segregation ATPase
MDDAELRNLVEGGFQSLREEISGIKTVHGQRLLALQEGDAAIQRQLTELSRVLAVNERVLDSLTRDIHQIRRTLNALRGDIETAHEDLPSLRKDVDGLTARVKLLEAR